MNRRTLLLFASLGLASTTSVAGQSVRARVFDSLGVRPLAGAVVQIETATGALVGRALTSPDGRAAFRRIGPGRYVLRVEMIGRESKILDFELSADVPEVMREVRLAERPIAIEGLDVSMGQRCTIEPEAGEAVRRVWDEARKALLTTAATEEAGLYDYETLLYERDLDRDLIRLENLEEERKESTRSAPFVTRSAEELIGRGFLEREDGSDVYFAPDAYLLMSDDFLAEHCFTLTTDDSDPEAGERLGLNFEPLALRGEQVGVRGTLWLDAESLELRHLDFGYTNLPPVRRDPRVGGEVSFERMPEGRWIVADWVIRMPTISLQRDRDYRMREFISGFREAGGVVLEATEAGERILDGGRLGSVSGTVVGSTGAAVEGARVDLEGTTRTVVTGADGHFLFDDLPEGFYQLLVTDAASRALGLSPGVRGLHVAPDDPPVVTLEIDANTRIRSECRERIPARPAEAPSGPWPPGEGVVVVQARDGSDRPIPNATIRLEWVRAGITITHAQPSSRKIVAQPSVTTEDVPVTASVSLDGFSYEGTTDENGRVRFCGVEEGRLLTLTGERAGGLLDEVTTRLDGEDRVRVIVLRPPVR